MYHFSLNFFEILKRFFEFHKVIMDQPNVNWLYYWKFWRGFEQSEHLSVV